TLHLGPFQGQIACTEIPMGKGVCGTAALKKQSIIVPNVDEFPSHISCDTRSKSELVVPLIFDGEIIGVFDLDSPDFNRFTEEDRQLLEEIVTILLGNSKPKNLFD